MKEDLLTVIVVNYNHELFLKDCIDSVLNQKVNFGFHIIVADDGSTDHSLEILRDYQKMVGKEKMEILTSKENQGLFKNVTRAYDRIKTDYFCVLDTDDYWIDMDFLQNAVDFLEENPDYTVYHANEYTMYRDGTKEVRYHMQEGSYTYLDIFCNRGKMCNNIVTVFRNVYYKNGLPEEIRILTDTPEQECFREDTSLNLLHLQYGKGYFVDKMVADRRWFNEGIYTSMTELQRRIEDTYFFCNYHVFFGEKNTEKYVAFIRNYFICILQEYERMVRNKEPLSLREKERYRLQKIIEWIDKYGKSDKRKIIPFSLERFSVIYTEGIMIWGTGKGASYCIEKYHIPMEKVLCFVDSSPEKWGTTFLGKEVISPDHMKEKDVNVLIASIYYQEIIDTIVEKNWIETDKIINVFAYNDGQ